MIRVATSDDAAAVAHLATELGYPVAAAPMKARLDEILRREDHALLVDERDGAVVGWIHGVVRNLVESAPYAEIGGFVVRGSDRGQGVGRGLLEALEAWARSRGQHAIRVRSNVVREDARRFYERHGYRISKRQAVFDKDLAEAPE